MNINIFRFIAAFTLMIVFSLLAADTAIAVKDIVECSKVKKSDYLFAHSAQLEGYEGAMNKYYKKERIIRKRIRMKVGSIGNVRGKKYTILSNNKVVSVLVYATWYSPGKGICSISITGTPKMLKVKLRRMYPNVRKSKSRMSCNTVRLKRASPRYALPDRLALWGIVNYGPASIVIRTKQVPTFRHTFRRTKKRHMDMFVGDTRHRYFLELASKGTKAKVKVCR